MPAADGAVRHAAPGRRRRRARPRSDDRRPGPRDRRRRSSARTPSQVTLANPYTFRATAIANVTGLLAAIALFALGLSVLVSAGLARRFTTPLRRLTEASRGLAEGDLPGACRAPGPGRLDRDRRAGVQFNAMADRLQESVEIIRRDRDRSRDFLADVSHELRTPLAALRTFNELLKEHAGDDPEARAEFLESSGQQIERLDWLAQNLLELSKLDSGPRPARPAAGRPARGGRVGRRADAAAARRRGVNLDAPPARRAGPDPPRPAADRPGRRQPRRQRHQVHAARRLGDASTLEPPTDGARIDRDRHGRRHRPGRAAAHLRAVLPRLAGERGARQRQRARASRSCARSWTCTAARRRREPASAQGSRFTVDAAARPAAAIAGHAGRGTGRRRASADAPRVPEAGRERDGNFTVRRPQVNPEPAP